MYEQAQPELDRILALVKTCPQDLQAKCFEVLLQGYVQSQLPRRPAEEVKDSVGKADAGRRAAVDTDATARVPAEIRTRLNNLAGRAKVPVEQLTALFDFTVDPFTFGTIDVAGKNNSEKARKIALLVAAKSYLITGKWTADWGEIKAVCADHNCYDPGNFAKHMQGGKGTIFKAVTVPTSIELSSTGTTQAQTLLGELATNAAK